MINFDKANYKQCPYCDELTDAHSDICEFCGEKIQTILVFWQKPEVVMFSALAIIIFIVALLCTISGFLQNEAQDHIDTKKKSTSKNEQSVLLDEIMPNSEAIVDTNYKIAQNATSNNQEVIKKEISDRTSMPRTDMHTNEQSSNDKPDFRPYMRNLQRSIKRNWNPPREISSKKVIVLFKVSKDGSLLSLDVLQSSGNQEADQAAISAVQTTAPFEPLPSLYKENDVEIKFSFDYNILGVSTEDKVLPVNNKDHVFENNSVINKDMKKTEDLILN